MLVETYVYYWVIGFAIAKAYAKAGATVVFNDNKPDLIDKGLATIAKTPAARRGTPEDL